MLSTIPELSPLYFSQGRCQALLYEQGHGRRRDVLAWLEEQGHGRRRDVLAWLEEQGNGRRACVSLAKGAQPVHFRAGGWLFYKESGVKYDMLCGPQSATTTPPLLHCQSSHRQS